MLAPMDQTFIGWIRGYIIIQNMSLFDDKKRDTFELTGVAIFFDILVSQQCATYFVITPRLWPLSSTFPLYKLMTGKYRTTGDEGSTFYV